MIELMNLREAYPSEPYDFRVDRHSPVGNPFRAKSEKHRDEACDAYEGYFHAMVSSNNDEIVKYLAMIQEALREHGKVRLFCWCVPKRCHGETIRQWLFDHRKQTNA